MADITMCAQKFCPRAEICYRIQAKPSNWQSMALFEYKTLPHGFECAHFLEVKTVESYHHEFPMA